MADFGPNIEVIPEESKVIIRGLAGPKTTHEVTLSALQLMALGKPKLLGMDPATYVEQEGEQINFLVCCILVGLSKRSRQGLTTPRLTDWLMESRDRINWFDLQKAFMYAIAYTKPEPQRSQTIRSYDDTFGKESEGPLEDGSENSEVGKTQSVSEAKSA